jgi:hypothetical protein
MTTAKGGLHRFKSNAAAGTYDEELGHVLSQVILVFGSMSTSRPRLSALVDGPEAGRLY